MKPNQISQTMRFVSQSRSQLKLDSIQVRGAMNPFETETETQAKCYCPWAAPQTVLIKTLIARRTSEL